MMWLMIEWRMVKRQTKEFGEIKQSHFRHFLSSGLVMLHIYGGITITSHLMIFFFYFFFV